MSLTTETGYEIPDKVEDEIKYRIKRLSREEIDNLYDKVGFKVVNAGDDGNKALTDKQIDSIKKGDDPMINNLLYECSEEGIELIVSELSIDQE